MTKWQKDFIRIWLAAIVFLSMVVTIILVPLYGMYMLFKYDVLLGCTVCALLPIVAISTRAAKKYADEEEQKQDNPK